MEETLPWKIIFIGTIFSLIVLGIAFYFITPPGSDFFTEETTDRIAEFSNVRIAGRKEGKRIWEFFASEGWSSKDREVTYLIEVKEGKIYHDENLVVTGLNAPKAKAYRRSEIIEAFGPLKGYLNLGRISHPHEGNKDEWTQMFANYLKYSPKKNQSEIKEDVILVKNDSSIFAEKIIVDHEKKIARVFGNIKLKREDGILTCKNLEYLSKEEKLNAKGSVLLDIKQGSSPTQIKCNKASFYTDMEKEMHLEGALEIVQGKKLAVAKEGIYSQKRREILLKGSVKAIFEKAAAILKEETTKNLKNPEAKKILKEKTVLTSDELVFSTKSGDAKASGSVFIFQKGKEAKSENAVYDDNKEIIILTGNVFMKKEQEWVKAKKVIISVKNESFEAIGEVEAELKM